MKVTVAFAVVACCVLGYFCGRSEAFECYVCTGSDNNCADPFSTSNKNDNCAMCGKTKSKTGDTQVVTRTCMASATGLTAGCTSASMGGASGEICYCDSALCNASTRASMTTALLFLLPAFVLSWKKL